MYEKAAHFLYSDTYGFIGEYLHISWQSRLVGRRSEAGDSIGGLPATGIAVYVADICPPISKPRTVLVHQLRGRDMQPL